jgi:spermidine synthase
LILTVLTGFSGLAYQVTWQKFISTLLGSHSEATAAVLGIFLGGLSVGYWLFGRVTGALVKRARGAGQPPRLLLTYGIIEASIGAYAIAFPTLFEGIRFLSYALPHGSPGLGFAIDVVLAALLLGPPTILMGGTIPILTQALARSMEDATRFHALVYAFNTVGAFAGALAAGFYLVPVLGLVRVMFAMGVVNLVAGGVFVVIGLRGHVLLAQEEKTAPRIEGIKTYAVIAVLIGFAMMVVQTSVIRVAGLAFGSSHFTFSIVVSIFVLCIALGSFAVSMLPSVRTWYIVANQWALAVLILVLYIVLPKSTYWAYVLRTLFRDESAGFFLYQFQTFLLMLVLIGPAVVCSGATLPLLFHQLRREAGELGNVAGTLYSWNTLGSLLGALLGGYVLLFWLDLHHVYRLALIALVVAAWLLTKRVFGLRRLSLLALIPLVVAPLALSAWDAKVLSLGLFRERFPLVATYAGMDEFLKYRFEYEYTTENVIHYEDDPTTSVTVLAYEPPSKPSLTLKTNGKPDGNTEADFVTMALAGVVPALFAKDPRRSFVIGYGTGITVGELAAFDSMEEVQVAEISSGVLRSAQFFDHMNLGASTNHKVKIVRSDAFRALMRAEGTFDVIASEPSNPWVTGVEMLYSREFLETARSRLSPGGVYGQWLHSYETDQATLELIFRTYASVFDHVSVWFLQGPDLLLLGFDDRASAMDHFGLEQRSRQPDFAAALERSGIRHFAALLAHELLPLGVLHAAKLQGPIHGLYHPLLGDRAGRAFFVGGDATLPFTGFGDVAAVGAQNSLLHRYAERFGGRLPEEQRRLVVNETCKYSPKLCAAMLAQWRVEDPESSALERLVNRASASGINLETVEALMDFYSDVPAEDDSPILIHLARAASERYLSHYHHSAAFNSEALLEVWRRCRVKPPTTEQCEEHLGNTRSSSPLKSEGEMADWLDGCSSKLQVGLECQHGADAARAMLSDGKVDLESRYGL